MRFYELNREPAIGDILQIELGDTLIETTIQDFVNDGVIIKLDDNAIKLIQEAVDKDIDTSRLGSFNLEPDRPKSEILYDPEYRPISDFQTAEFCENVIDWALTVLNSLDLTVRKFLVSAGEPSIIKFLKDQAQDSNAYSRYGFTDDDLDSCKDYLPTVTRDAGIQSWEDYLDFNIHESISEAEYQGRKVSLGKPTKGDVKKSKVYVRKPNGKIVKVNFGDPNMKIKKSNPKRRKSFRARHNCDNPGPRWKARYWSCRAW